MMNYGDDMEVIKDKKYRIFSIYKKENKRKNGLLRY